MCCRDVQYRCRCSPGMLIELVKLLTEEQKNAVCELGFGCLLKLRVVSLPQKIVPLLLKVFCPSSHMIKVGESKEFLLSKHDVHDMFMLPISDTPLKMTPTSRAKGSSNVELKEYWRNHFGITNKKDSIPLTSALARLKEMIKNKEVSDEFKKLFVWYSMAVFFSPTSNYVLDLELVHAIDNVLEIPKQDWCQYVFDSLIKASEPPLKKYLCGCMLFLILTYLHRFDFRGVRLDSTLPLIQHWDKASLEDRVKLELQSKRLGDAPLSSVSFPIYLHSGSVSSVPAQPQVNSELPSSPIHVEEQDDGHRQPTTCKKMVIDLPDDAHTTEEIAAMNIDVNLRILFYFIILLLF